MIEVVLNDRYVVQVIGRGISAKGRDANYKRKAHVSSLSSQRLGKKVRVKCNEDDTIGDLKKLAAAQLGTRPEKLKIQKWFVITVWVGWWARDLGADFLTFSWPHVFFWIP